MTCFVSRRTVRCGTFTATILYSGYAFAADHVVSGMMIPYPIGFKDMPFSKNTREDGVHCVPPERWSEEETRLIAMLAMGVDIESEGDE